MSPVRALLQSMPPLFDIESDLEEHVRDLQEGEEESQLDALLLASLENSLLTAAQPEATLRPGASITEVLQPDQGTEVERQQPLDAGQADASRLADASRRAEPVFASPAPEALETGTISANSEEGKDRTATPVASGVPTELAITSTMPGVVELQLVSHRADLASVDQKLAHIDLDIDKVKAQAAEVTQALKLRQAQRACLLGLRRAHAQFITRCSKDA